MEINYLQILIGLVSGSLASTLVGRYLEQRKYRKQPIGFESQLATVYKAFDKGNVSSQISITWQNKEYRFKNLMVARVEFQNKGNQDYPDFDFGLEPVKEIKIIQVTKVFTDRYHNVEIMEEPTFENPKDGLDVVLKPFNRRDSYVLEILCASDAEVGMWQFTPKTTKPVTITNIEPAAEGEKLWKRKDLYVVFLAFLALGLFLSQIFRDDPPKPGEIQTPPPPSATDSISNTIEKIRAKRNESEPGV